MRRPVSGINSAVVLVAIFLTGVLGTTGTAFCSGMTSLRSLVLPGEDAPPFTLKNLDGKSVGFKPAGGKASLIVFWSAFCPLCRELTPAINDIALRHSATIRLVSINLDGKRFTNAVNAFIKENRMRYPVLLDTIRDDFFIASDPYGVEKAPTAVLVDAKGKVYSAYPGERMREMVKEFDEIVVTLKKGQRVKK
jgi:peroxiredoxin